MKTVNFTEMKSGTKDEYLLLDRYEQEYINGTADRVLNFKIKQMKKWLLPLYCMI